ncbi:antibiotic biosynthesis monooxygenase [Staphylococcus chromogenes]|uniref:Signal transduction protein TRAP n=2 Tax=Staphylococcus chromogenes TaxID=46126 RepID=A0AAE5T0F7_STACR|nr:antibiotic biosynthesis monooxygenase [Staphylococcus chromogenes]RIL87581.1 antibiotic biosynthesis monooxygenase [Staphylococcus equorum]PTF42357.1 antibiotic biosynthesis monooxygenase [Staphylococcus chromogenes]PTF49120.1 antibiotic biosynthesis monooxygenase [Staphylococcus chromogenes]PTF51295.1 antibiotic biosynthesis monooxygenase [Staphylococcus chromogenes]
MLLSDGIKVGIHYMRRRHLMEILDVNKNYRIRFEDLVYIDKNNETKAYQPLDVIGNPIKESYVVLNYIKVLEGHSETFEQQCFEKDFYLEERDGFQGYYFLRLENDVDQYLIITLWQDVQYYEDWFASEGFQQAFREIIECDIVNCQLTYKISFYDETFKRAF